MRKSTLSAGSPLFWIVTTGPGDAGAAVSMKTSFGSTRRTQTSRKTLRGSRFLSEIWTGASGTGKRSDSEKVRESSFASPVVSHSPYTDAKPRE